MSKSPRLHIYYDGECPMCTAFAKTVSTGNSEQTLIDVTTTDTLPTDKTTLLKEIHVYEADGTIRTGADAVLTSLARIYSWLKPIVFLIRVPGIAWIARQGYFFISKRRRLWFGGDTARLYWLYLLTVLGLLLGLLLSWPLWQVDRLYPTLPVITSLSALASITPFLSLVLVSILAGGLFFTKNFHWIARIGIGLLLLLVLFDITRAQPWVVHYTLLIALFCFWYQNSFFTTERLLDAARYIVAGIYFWSGIQKINTAFYLETFPWFTAPLWEPFGDTGATIMLSIGVFVPFIELLLALGLLTKRFRTISIIGSGLMLLLVTASLMIGRDWNVVVWPWNFALFGMVITLFYSLDTSLPTLLSRTKHNLLAFAAIGICFVMPIGNVFGYIDHYLSWSLYSGHVPTATITATPETILALHPDAQIDETKDLHTMRFATWSLATIGVPPYPEERVFTALFSQICSNHPQDTTLKFGLTTRDFFLSNRPQEMVYTCASLPTSIIVD